MNRTLFEVNCAYLVIRSAYLSAVKNENLEKKKPEVCCKKRYRVIKENIISYNNIVLIILY